MIRTLGNMIWKQTREINVMNYGQYLVYQIPTNQGFLEVYQSNHDTKEIKIKYGEIKEWKPVECVESRNPNSLS